MRFYIQKYRSPFGGITLAGGTDKKIALLKLEGADVSGLFVPKRGTAL